VPYFTIHFNNVISILFLGLFFFTFNSEIKWYFLHDMNGFLGIEWGYLGSCVCKCIVK